MIHGHVQSLVDNNKASQQQLNLMSSWIGDNQRLLSCILFRLNENNSCNNLKMQLIHCHSFTWHAITQDYLHWATTSNTSFYHQHNNLSQPITIKYKISGSLRCGIKITTNQWQLFPYQRQWQDKCICNTTAFLGHIHDNFLGVIEFTDSYLM